MLTRTAYRISALISLVVALMLATLVGVSSVMAAPAAKSLRAQNVDWMSADEATSLDLSFPVLVPTFIPAPFGGSPAIDGGGGYYSLYWVNLGGPPTYLHIEGQVGGTLPAGSPADLNVQLSVNASVQGYNAIHDVTDIYDNVWWVANGVLYTVSSKNMTGTDSLSLANSLIALEPPVVEEPDPPTPTPPPAVDESDEPVQVDVTESEIDNSGAGVPDQPADNADGQGDVVETPTPVADGDEPGGVGGNIEATAEPDGSTDRDDTADSLSSSISGVDGNSTRSSTPASLSDGTAGPALPTGGDGTGGIFQVAFP